MSDILTGWKEIAAHLKVYDRTAREWGAKEGLPHTRIRGTVITTKGEISSWISKKIKSRAKQT